jgi:hypothetical protein
MGTILFVPSGYIFKICAWSVLGELEEYALVAGEG